MTIDEAKIELSRARDAALASYAKDLLSHGADFDSAEFRTKVINYAGTLEAWRSDAMARLRRLVAAHAENPSPTLN
jgi:hypothetical protein